VTGSLVQVQDGTIRVWGFSSVGRGAPALPSQIVSRFESANPRPNLPLSESKQGENFDVRANFFAVNGFQLPFHFD